TIVQAFTVAVVVSFYDQMAVLQAFLLTLGVTGGLTLYTFQSKRDFSTLYAFLMVLLMGSLLQFFLTSSHLEFVLSLGGAVLFSFFIIFDTHMLMHRVSPEEYILATIELYLDIINLFSAHSAHHRGRRGEIDESKALHAPGAFFVVLCEDVQNGSTLLKILLAFQWIRWKRGSKKIHFLKLLTVASLSSDYLLSVI
ncbi:hypothetical protein MTO96_035006, partial [Rhipicephalus appendiculatus]